MSITLSRRQVIAVMPDGIITAAHGEPLQIFRILLHCGHQHRIVRMMAPAAGEVMPLCRRCSESAQ